MQNDKSTQPTAHRYLEPDWFTAHVMNRLARRLTRMGVSVWGSRELRVRGRSSGETRSTVVNLLEVDGTRYLVSPRGTTQWARNLRAAGTGELRRGRKVEAFRAVEVDDADKAPLLRAYLRRWKFEVGQFFDGVDADASDVELTRIAPGYPVFRVDAVATANTAATAPRP